MHNWACASAGPVSGTGAGCIEQAWEWIENKANLRDFIAATGLVMSDWIQIIDLSASVILKFD